MARGGINLALVRKAREALVARGQNRGRAEISQKLGHSFCK